MEIPLKEKYRRIQSYGRNKSTSGNSGTNKHRGEVRRDVREAAQAVTTARRPTLTITASGKRRWIRPDSA